MTPQNDAPIGEGVEVTAAGYAEAEAMLLDLIGRHMISDTAIRVARDHMMQFARRHRLEATRTQAAEVQGLVDELRKRTLEQEPVEDAYWAAIVNEVKGAGTGFRHAMLTNHHSAYLLMWAEVGRLAYRELAAFRAASGGEKGNGDAK